MGRGGGPVAHGGQPSTRCYHPCVCTEDIINDAQNGSFYNVTDNQILLTDPGQDAFYHSSNQLLM